MSWVISDDLDNAITLIREDYERITKKSISKKDMILKILYQNDGTRRLLESNGVRVNKKIFKMPKV